MAARLTVVPLTAQHLKTFTDDDPELYLGDFSWVAMREGEPIAASGIAEQWTGRGVAWFTAKSMTLREWAEVTRLVREGLERARNQGYRRIEVAIRDGHESGHRWAQRLGFEPEALCRKYLSDGGDGWLYAVVFPDQGPGQVEEA